eukprot:403339438
MSSSLSSMNNLKPPSHLHQPLSSQNNYHRSKSPINKTHGINLNQQQQLISNNSNYLKIPQSSTTPNSNMQSLKQQMNNTSHSGSMNLNNISSSNILCTKTSDQSGVSQNISGGGNLNASGKFKKTASIYGVSRDAQSEKLQMQNIQIPKENIQFKQLYSTKDFAVIERIIKKAEKSKKIQKKRCVNGTNSITLSEIIEAYKKVMMKKGIEVLNETHYYALIIKLSLNQHGNTWRQCLEHEKKKNQMKRLSIQHYRYLIVKKYFCKWIENYVQTYRSMQMKSQISHSRQQSPIFVNSERIMMSTIRPQDAQTPISSKSVPFGEITNHTQNFANKTQPNQSQIHSEKQLLFTQPTAQETEFIKNIINLSGQKAIIAQTTQPQSNFNKNFSLTGFSQNLFLTNFGITQSNMQSQDLVIEPSSNQLRSLERSYQKRKKERALGNINKVLVKQLKMTTFNEQNIDFITQKAFQKWALVARTQTHVIKQKEDFINKWMVAFEHYNFKRYATVFQALKNVGIKLRDLEERELKLRCQFENKLINTTFFTWIDKLNRRINYRKQLYKAVNHWSSRLNIKTIQKWKIFMHQQQDVKLRFRNFKMINYIKAFLSLGVPNDIKNQDSNYSDQLQTLIEIRKLKHFNPEEVNQSIYFYERVYQKLDLAEGIRREFSKLINIQKVQKASENLAVIFSLKDNPEEKNLLFYLKRTFKGLRDITQHLKLTKAKGYCLDNLIKEQTIKSIFMNWQQTAFQYKRASRQRFVKLTRKTFELLSMGIFAQRYLNDALKRGMKQRKKSLKRKLIVFLREGLQTLEQRTDYFMKRRYFRNHYRTLEIKNYYDQKLQIFSLYKLKQTQFNVIQGFLMHMNSQEHKNNKKARFHYLSQLIFKSMQTLKRITWLGKAQNFANGEAIIYLQRRKCQRLLREWQKVIQNEQQKRMMHSLAIFQNENSLRLRLIQLLQYNIKQNNQKRQEFRMKDIKAYWLRLQRVFSRWHQYADFKKQLKQKQNVLQQYQNQKQKQIYFNQIKTQFRSILVIKSLQSQRKEKLQLKYFNLWRDFNFNSKLQNQKKFEIDNYHSAKLAKQYFLRLKGYTNLKKEKNFKNMQCTIYYFRRVLKIFMSTLHHQAYKSNYLRINYQNYVVAKQQKLISNSFKTWKRNFNYSKIDIGSAVYRKRQCFLRFQNQLKAQKLRKIVDQNKELKVIELLVYKLQKRAFQGLKANMQFGGYKRKMEQIQTDYMIRKWFEKWRQAYQNFAQDNYLENNDIDDKSSIVSFKASENKYFEIKKPLNNNRGTAIKRNKENSPTKSTFSIKKQNQTYMSGGGFLGNKLNFINV